MHETDGISTNKWAIGKVLVIGSTNLKGILFMRIQVCKGKFFSHSQGVPVDLINSSHHRLYQLSMELNCDGGLAESTVFVAKRALVRFLLSTSCFKRTHRLKIV